MTPNPKLDPTAQEHKHQNTNSGGGSSVDGFYRVDGPSSFTVIADTGAFVGHTAYVVTLTGEVWKIENLP